MQKIMENKPSLTKKSQLKKSFSAPVLKPQLNKSSNANDKEQNYLEHNAESSKSTEKEKHFKQAETAENLSNLTQSKKKSLKEGNKKQPKSLCVIDYEELFRNVINTSEIKKLDPEESSLDKICSDKTFNIDEKVIVKAGGVGDSVNIFKINADVTCVKPPLLNDINDMDSIASDEIDEWDNLSTVAKEENESTPMNKVNCNNDIAVVKKNITKQNKLPPKQLFTKSEIAKAAVDIQDKKTNLIKETIDSVLSQEPNKRKKIRKPSQSTVIGKDCNTDLEKMCVSEKEETVLSKKSKKKKRKQSQNTVQVKDSNTDLESSCLSEEEETGTWVQCTNCVCNKWRYLQDIEDPQLVPDNWECKMNSDKEHNACNLPEVRYDESEHIFTKYTLGSVVWAKMDGFPWWPALIDNDPDYETYFEIPTEDCMVPTNFHVTFFGNCASRAWIKPACIIPYEKNELKCKTSVGHKKDINLAMMLAETALDMSLKERIEQYGFVKLFRKKSQVKKKSVCESDELPKLNSKKCRSYKDRRAITKSSHTNGDSQINSKFDILKNTSLEALSENSNQSANENKVNKENAAVHPNLKDKDKEMISKTNINIDISVTNSEQSILQKQEHNKESELEIINSNNIQNESKLTKKANKKMKLNINKKRQQCKENTIDAEEDHDKKEKRTTIDTSESAIETTLYSCEAQSFKNHFDLEKENINPLKNDDVSLVKSVNNNKLKDFQDKTNNSSKKEIKTKNVNLKKVTLKSSTCDSITNKDVEGENIDIATDKTEQITLNRKHKSKACHKERISKKLKNNKELNNIDLQATLDNKIKKKKNTFSVPVPKIVQSLPPSSSNSSSVDFALPTSDTNLVSPCKDDSHTVPDIKMSLDCEDTTNGDELELESDMKPVLLKCTEESKKSLAITKQLSLNFDQPDDKGVLSDDDSSDFILDLETEDENKVMVEAFSEVHGRFGGRCFEHGSDSDPLDLIED